MKGLNRIQEIRDLNDISIKELSIASKVSESTIGRIERGERVPNQKTMLKICYGLRMCLNCDHLEWNEVFETRLENVKIV
jgi:transcriptional regulator with XRE-family HTH domain